MRLARASSIHPPGAQICSRVTAVQIGSCYEHVTVAEVWAGMVYLIEYHPGVPDMPLQKLNPEVCPDHLTALDTLNQAQI